jgi:hypothetical protein
MSVRQGLMGVAVIGIVLLALSVLGVVAGFVTGITLNIDGLLLLAVSLMMAAVFAGVVLMHCKRCGWIGKKHDEAAEAKAK